MENYREFKVRRDLMSNWMLENPILAEKELICVVCMDGDKLVNRYKLGDGKTHYIRLKLLDRIPDNFRIRSVRMGDRENVEINLNGIDIMFRGDKDNLAIEEAILNFPEVD
ncbi:MAG: hypothetical protein LUH21_04640 [Clostridiales bacterium]|nr:hypothetical protein [Clostridiales bacterium]